MARGLDQQRRFNNFFRTLLFVPWAVPIVIVALNWRWIFDDLSGFLNNFLITFHLTSNIISWLSDPGLAMACVIAVVVWAGTPLYSMTFLAGLQAIPRELYEAASVDGATPWHRFWHITLPGLKHVMIVTTLLSFILTINDFNIIYVMTRGGPGSATQIFATYSYQVAFNQLRWGRGVTICLFVVPILVLGIILISRYLLRDKK